MTCVCKLTWTLLPHPTPPLAETWGPEGIYIYTLYIYIYTIYIYIHYVYIYIYTIYIYSLSIYIYAHTQTHLMKCKTMQENASTFQKETLLRAPWKDNSASVHYFQTISFKMKLHEIAWKWMKLNDVPLDQSVLFSIDPSRTFMQTIEKKRVSWGVRNHITLDVSQPNVYCKYVFWVLFWYRPRWYKSLLVECPLQHCISPEIESDDFNIRSLTSPLSPPFFWPEKWNLSLRVASFFSTTSLFFFRYFWRSKSQDER